MIVTLDDDRLYRRQPFIKLKEWAEVNPDRVMCVSGGSITDVMPGAMSAFHVRESHFVDIVRGTHGTLYRKGFFQDGLVFNLLDKEAPKEFAEACYFVDDLWLSGHLERLRIGKMQVPGFKQQARDSGLQNKQGLYAFRGNRDCICACALREHYGIWRPDAHQPKAGDAKVDCEAYCEDVQDQLSFVRRQRRHDEDFWQKVSHFFAMLTTATTLWSCALLGTFCYNHSDAWVAVLLGRKTATELLAQLLAMATHKWMRVSSLMCLCLLSFSGFCYQFVEMYDRAEAIYDDVLLGQLT